MLLTVAAKDREDLPEVARAFRDLGYRLLATKGTKEFLDGLGVTSELILKTHEGRPHIVDAIKNGEIEEYRVNMDIIFLLEE